MLRGVYYRPDMDETAYKAARAFFDEASAAIRRRAKVADLPVELMIHKAKDGSVYAEVSASVVK